ncbi:MAG: DUF4406 domain-containing protein [Phycisphaerales bacterium]|nr:MAG: DUF4406 domain-containing protein [Phycisphaerales bacterium]
MEQVPHRLYLAGPMSGYPKHNFPLFNRVATRLRDMGYHVFNPAENKDGGKLRPRSFYMWLDIPALLESEAVVVLPGWEHSRGASLEVWLAVDLDIPVYQCSELDGRVQLQRAERLELNSLPFRPDVSSPSFQDQIGMT